jgi:sigma-B regulation protein RsbU (phosphoserine phosphatase)
VPGVDLAAMSQPAKQVGGDFYDITVLNEGQFALTVADVSGKSLPAALFMASTSSIIRTLAQNIQSPKQLLEKANDLIYQSSEAGMFVTLFYIFLDLQQGEIRYSSAGHNQQILLKENGEVRYLQARGSPLGILPLDLHGNFASGTQAFERGDILVLYTDGVIEAINSEQEEFEEERFLSVVHKLRRQSAQEIIDGVFQAVNDFAGEEPQFDDFTMVVAKYESDRG